MADGRVVIDTLLNASGAERGIKNLGRTLSSSLGRIAGIVATAFSVGAMVNFGKQAIELASDISEVQNVVDTAFESMSYKMEEFANTSIEMYGISKLTAKRTGSTYMSMARGLGLSMEQASDMAITLTGLTADMASFYNVSQEVADTAIKSVFTGETESLKQYGIVMTQTNLQEFAAANGIKKKVQNMTQAEQVQLRYAYVLEQTALAQGDFAKTSDSWANQTRILEERWKEFLSIVGNGLVQVLTPLLKMLNNIVGGLIAIATNLSNMFGFTTEVAQSNAQDISSSMSDVADSTDKAADATKKESDALDDTADSAKKADKALNGILGKYDELNVISTPTDSSSDKDKDKDSDISDSLANMIANLGGNTGQANIEASKVGSEAGNSMADMIKRAFETADFTEIGNSVGTKLKNALDKIPWDGIKESCERIAKSVGTFINGFVDSGIFQSFGSNLAQALNTVLLTADTFFTTVKWDKLGSALTSSVQTFFQTIDWKLVGKTIIDYAIAKIDFIRGLIEGIDWKALPGDIVTAISGVLSGADWGGLALSLVDLGVAIFDGLQEFIRGLTGDNPILTGIADAILVALVALKFSGYSLSAFVTNMTPVLAPLATNVFKAFGLSLAAAFAGFSVGKWIGEQLLSEDDKKDYTPDWNPFDYTLDEWLQGLKDWWDEGVIPWWEDKFDSLGDKVDKITEPFKDAWDGIKDKSVELVTSVKEKVAGKLEELKEDWDIIKDKAAELVAEAKEKVKGKIAELKEGWNSIKDKTAELLGEAKEKVKGKIAELKEGWNSVKDKTAELVAEAKEKVKGKITELKQGWDSVKDKTADLIASAKEKTSGGIAKLKEGWDSVKDKTANLKAEVKSKWSDLKSKWTNITSKIKNKTANFKGAITQKWSNISARWTNITSNIKDKTANFKGSITQRWSDIRSKWTNITDNVKDKVVSFSAKVTTTAETIKNTFKRIFNSVFTWINTNFIDRLNSMFQFTIGGFTNPLTGKYHAGSTIKLLNLPHIPQLATGAVLPANSPFMAMVGDQKHGTNIEAPLDTIVDAFKTAINEFGVNVTFEVQGDPDKIFKIVQKKDSDNYRRTGRPSFNI